VDDLNEKPQLEVQSVTWDALEPHAARGSLLVVAPDLELIEVAEKVACDDASAVGTWVAGGCIYKPSAEMIQQWKAEENALFSFVIVQPYVLCQRPNH